MSSEDRRHITNSAHAGKAISPIAELLAIERNNESLQERYKDWAPSNAWFENVMKCNYLVSTRLHGDAGEIDCAEAEKNGRVPQ
jgi:hypothetical protein